MVRLFWIKDEPRRRRKLPADTLFPAHAPALFVSVVCIASYLGAPVFRNDPPQQSVKPPSPALVGLFERMGNAVDSAFPAGYIRRRQYHFFEYFHRVRREPFIAQQIAGLPGGRA